MDQQGNCLFPAPGSTLECQLYKFLKIPLYSLGADHVMGQINMSNWILQAKQAGSVILASMDLLYIMLKFIFNKLTANCFASKVCIGCLCPVSHDLNLDIIQHSGFSLPTVTQTIIFITWSSFELWTFPCTIEQWVSYCTAFGKHSLGLWEGDL